MCFSYTFPIIFSVTLLAYMKSGALLDSENTRGTLEHRVGGQAGIYCR